MTVDYDTPVNFTFQHLLSKVHFTVTSTAQGDYSHKVTGIKVYNYAEGTYTINGGTWNGNGDPVAVTFADIAGVSSTNGNTGVSNADMLLVPTAATYNVTFTVELYKGTTKLGTETKIIHVEKDLVKGNAYNFTIACSVGNPIQFRVTNNPTWNSDIDGDGDVDANDNVKID